MKIKSQDFFLKNKGAKHQSVLDQLQFAKYSVMGFPNERRWGWKKVIEIIAENVPNLIKIINPYFQEAKRNPSIRNKKIATQDTS